MRARGSRPCCGKSTARRTPAGCDRHADRSVTPKLIHLVGKAGGVAAAYRTMAAMGLLAVPAAYAGPPALPPGRGRRIVILGAGIAGMVLGLELEKAGYAPLILEARTRPGGRNWSLRAGDMVQETDSVQHVAWDAAPHLYFNPGPARIPYHHDGILSYCRQLGVPLEIICNENRAALMQDDAAFDGVPQLNGRVVNDARGYVAELAAKAVDQAALADPVSSEDKERLRGFLRAFGALDRDLAYRGSSRSGWVTPPGGGWSPEARTHRLICTPSWHRISGKGRCSSENLPTCRRRCYSLSAAWGASVKRSAAKCTAASCSARK